MAGTADQTPHFDTPRQQARVKACTLYDHSQLALPNPKRINIKTNNQNESRKNLSRCSDYECWHWTDAENGR